jgi:hypothetical protein
MVLLEWAKPTWPQPSWPSPRCLSARGRGRGTPRRSTAVSIPASGDAVRWGCGSERWPVRWGTQFGRRRRRRLTRGRCPWGRGLAGGELWWGVAAGGGGWRLTAREDGRDTGGHWGGVNGARQWLEAARRWSATVRHASAAEEWGRWDGARRSRSGREILHCNHAHWIRAQGAAHGADVCGGARAADAWPSRFDIWIGDLLDFQSGPDIFYLLRFLNIHILIFELVTFLISKFYQILQVDNLEEKEKLYFLDQIQNTKGLQVINSGINSNLNLTWILKGFKPF